VNADEIATAEAALPAARQAIADARQALVAALRAIPGYGTVAENLWTTGLIAMALQREHLSSDSASIASARRALQAAILAEREIIAVLNSAKPASVSA
jgi:hypothetical protein